MNVFQQGTLPHLVVERAVRFTENVLFTFQEEDYTYGRVYQECSRIGAFLQRLGLQQGDRVVVALPNVPEVLLSFTAVALAGCTFIPTNPNLTEREIAYLLLNSRAKGVIATAEFLRKVAHVLPRLSDTPFLLQVRKEDRVPQAMAWGDWGEESLALLQVDVKPLDQVMMIYTSGTTGNPKGVMISHQGFLNNVHRLKMLFQMTERDVSINMLPYTHVFAPLVEWAVAVDAGSRFVLRENFHPRGVLEDVQRYGGTFLAGVPSMYAMLLDEMSHRTYDVNSLRLGFIAAAPVPRHVQEGFEERTGCAMIQGYGQTETLLVTFEPIDRPHGLHPGTCGTNLFADVEIRLIDEDGKDVPLGEIGEFYVKTPDVMLGYFEMPEETAKVMNNGWIHTGDLGYKDEDGYYYVVDRVKHMIISSGRNIYPAEIENTLVALPQVKEAAVIGIPDELRGESVEAFIVLKEGQVVSEREVLDCLRANLTDYKVPRRIHLVDSFPHTVSGKIRKVQFREDYMGRRAKEPNRQTKDA